MRVFTWLIPSIISSGLVWSAAVPHVATEIREPQPVDLVTRDATTLSASALSALTPFARFANAAYCPTSKLQSWNCGSEYTLHQFTMTASSHYFFLATCSSIPGFELTLTGGDGNGIQFCMYYIPQHRSETSLKRVTIDFVGYWPDQNAVVVTHQGTDPTKL